MDNPDRSALKMQMAAQRETLMLCCALTTKPEKFMISAR
jgi:hypothetical protein